MAKNEKYEPGNPEYDYWNDKNLYPSLRNEGDDLQGRRVNDLGNAEIRLGSVFVVVFIWMVIFAPVALFLTWESWVTKVVFWGGLVIIGITFIAWLCSAIESEKAKKYLPKKSVEDPNAPWYKKYPPADVVKKEDE